VDMTFTSSAPHCPSLLALFLEPSLALFLEPTTHLLWLDARTTWLSEFLCHVSSMGLAHYI
jgi:hypothetical protein